MDIIQLINSVTVDLHHFGQTYDISLNWIGQIIEWLISGIGYVGLGIIVFSLFLKLIVLPLDIYQRVVMRKQNNKMQENQAKMEKLQNYLHYLLEELKKLIDFVILLQLLIK